MKISARIQSLIIVILALVAIAVAIPAMHDTPIEKFFRGECYWRGKGGSPSCQVPSQNQLLQLN